MLSPHHFILKSQKTVASITEKENIYGRGKRISRRWIFPKPASASAESGVWAWDWLGGCASLLHCFTLLSREISDLVLQTTIVFQGPKQQRVAVYVWKWYLMQPSTLFYRILKHILP